MDEIKEELIKFQAQRDWKKFHTPENLAKSISIEAGELLEHFQWGYEWDIDEVADELADVLNYCFLMAIELDLDVKEIILNKMEKKCYKIPSKKRHFIILQRIAGNSAPGSIFHYNTFLPFRYFPSLYSVLPGKA